MNKKIKNLAIASALSGAFVGISVDTASATEMKEKWELNRNEIMTVGKYLNSNNDYINLMKVCKKHENFVEEYHFNPISDTSLFTKLPHPVNNVKGTQHFYNNADVANMLPGLYGYVYHNNTIQNNKVPVTILDGVLQIKYEQIHDRRVISLYAPTVIRKISQCGTFANIHGFNFVRFFNAIQEFNAHAFENTDLQRIVVPEGVERILECCFKNCLQLNNIVLPSTLKIISHHAFENTQITQIAIPPFVAIYKSCFVGCNQLIKIQLSVGTFKARFNSLAEENANDGDEVETMSKDFADKTIEIELTANNVQAPAVNDERLANPIFLAAVNGKLDSWFGITGNPNLQRKNVKSIKILN